MKQLRQEIEQTLNEERKHLRDMDEKGWVTSDRGITEGWTEALEYVLGRMERMIDTSRYEGHTPGGWYVDDAMDVIHPTVIHSNETDNIIAELVMANAEEWTEEDYANARLIADAPLLLERLKEMIE